MTTNRKVIPWNGIAINTIVCAGGLQEVTCNQAAKRRRSLAPQPSWRLRKSSPCTNKKSASEMLRRSPNVQLENSFGRMRQLNVKLPDKSRRDSSKSLANLSRPGRVPPHPTHWVWEEIKAGIRGTTLGEEKPRESCRGKDHWTAAVPKKNYPRDISRG